MFNPPTPLRAVRRVVVVAVGLLLTITAVSARPLAAEAAPSCAAFSSKVYDEVNPATTAQILTTHAASFVGYQARGFTETRPYSLTAASVSGSSLGSVHQLYRAKNKNYFYSLDPAEIARAIKSYGYVDQGRAFYAATQDASCLKPVWSFHHPAGYHRFVTTQADQDYLSARGWRRERVRFYLGEPSLASVFTLAVMPDTQQEVLNRYDRRFADRVGWLTANEAALDLRFVTHTGDIVNWDTSDHAQYEVAESALDGLNGKIPYSVTIGNHDTAAVGPGGGAADPKRTRILVRDTSSANAYFDDATAAKAGQFEVGKIDNAYHTFSAGGLEWMVLNLELWPRRTAVAWARDVVADHPDHNVIIATHSYLMGNRSLYQKSDYGETSPQYLFDNLVKVYPNVKMVLSGHTGSAAHRRDTGVNGNRIHSLLLTMHDNRTNPLRLIEINTKTNTMASFVYGPSLKRVYPDYWIRPEHAGWTR